MNDILWLTMRRLRTPLIVLILVYSLSVFGLVMIPGEDAAGEPFRMGYLDASYFVAIMATTIGFGEMPVTFTHAQRLYAFIILFPNVVAWLYSIGTIISLLVDPQFRAVLKRSRFGRGVERIRGDYYIVCGFGNTGRMIVRGLLRRNISAVIIEREQELIHGMALDADFAHLPGLAGDVTDRRLLEIAGLNPEIRNCRGVIAITNEDHANLTIAITSKLLRPDLPVLARSENPRVSANMASFGTDLTINPYAIFAERLRLALGSPVKYLVQDWLISVPGTRLREPLNPPVGPWILAGVGRFGSLIAEKLEDAGVPYTIIDVHTERVEGRSNAVLGRGTEAKTLREAGVEEAVAIVAGTGDDVDNLSIIMTARELNPDLFVIARQENPHNDELFDKSGAQLVARRSLIVARRIIAVSTTPLLPVFLDHLLREDDDFAQRVEKRLDNALSGYSPSLWTLELSGEQAYGIQSARRFGVEIRLEHITHNSRKPGAEKLACACLLLERGASRTFMPRQDQPLMEGDRLLFAGRGSARREMLYSLAEPTALIGFATGKPQPRGAIMRYLAERRRSA